MLTTRHLCTAAISGTVNPFSSLLAISPLFDAIRSLSTASLVLPEVPYRWEREIGG